MKYLLTFILAACLANAANASNETVPEKIQGLTATELHSSTDGSVVVTYKAPGLFERIKRGVVSTASATTALVMLPYVVIDITKKIVQSATVVAAMGATCAVYGAAGFTALPVVVPVSGAVGAGLVSSAVFIALYPSMVKDYHMIWGTGTVQR